MVIFSFIHSTLFSSLFLRKILGPGCFRKRDQQMFARSKPWSKSGEINTAFFIKAISMSSPLSNSITQFKKSINACRHSKICCCKMTIRRFVILSSFLAFLFNVYNISMEFMTSQMVVTRLSRPYDPAEDHFYPGLLFLFLFSFHLLTYLITSSSLFCFD